MAPWARSLYLSTHQQWSLLAIWVLFTRPCPLQRRKREPRQHLLCSADHQPGKRRVVSLSSRSCRSIYVPGSSPANRSALMGQWSNHVKAFCAVMCSCCLGPVTQGVAWQDCWAGAFAMGSTVGSRELRDNVGVRARGIWLRHNVSVIPGTSNPKHQAAAGMAPTGSEIVLMCSPPQEPSVQCGRVV